jgi:hypothetical protein
MMLLFRTRGPGFIETFELHHLAVTRQVQSCSCHIDYFLSIYSQINILITPALKIKCYFSNYEYDYVVGNGTMVCVDGGDTIARVIFI